MGSSFSLSYLLTIRSTVSQNNRNYSILKELPYFTVNNDDFQQPLPSFLLNEQFQKDVPAVHKSNKA